MGGGMDFDREWVTASHRAERAERESWVAASEAGRLERQLRDARLAIRRWRRAAQRGELARLTRDLGLELSANAALVEVDVFVGEEPEIGLKFSVETFKNPEVQQ